MDDVDTLLVDVRAGTQGFAQDIAAMRATFDGTLVAGFERAGTILERGLLGAIRRGGLGFDDLRRIALKVIDDIAAQAVRGLFSGGVGGGSDGGIGDLVGRGGDCCCRGGFGGPLAAILGLPGRATGGPVAPGRGYLVGERGPELFVPASAGRVEAMAGTAREVRVSISIVSPPGTGAPQALQRSSRQLASAVRRALVQS